MKICHLTSAHNQHDVRILLKECSSLAKHFNTTLVVVNGENEVLNNVNIESINCSFNSRFKRFTKVVNLVLKKAIEIDADIYHLHDPELLRIVKTLRKRNKKIIYDVHEDLPRQILSKPWINITLRKLVSIFIEKYENYIASKLDLIITATPFICNRFKQINKNTIDINNFPLQNEVEVDIQDKIYTNKLICYIGGITKIRGIKKLVEAINEVDGLNLAMAGSISPEGFRDELQELEGWNKVDELGFVDRDQALEIKKKSVAGIVTFLPEPNHINAQPNKIFEYMASGLPVICSDFELWKHLIVENNCGFCVDPNNPKAIAGAIKKLINNPDKAKKMGQNGKRLVLEKYNWSNEEIKLINAYKSLHN